MRTYTVPTYSVPAISNSSFLRRHIGPTPNEIQDMLKFVDYTNSLDELVKKTIPNNLLIEHFDVGEPIHPEELIQKFQGLSQKNNTTRTYLGQGFYRTTTPSFIMRTILSNPAW